MGEMVVAYDSASGGFKTKKVGTDLIASGAVTQEKINTDDPFIVQQTSAPQLRHVAYGAWGATPVYNPIAVDASGYMYFNAVWPDGSVTSSKIAAGAVGTPHLIDGAITSAKLASGQVGDAHIYPASILSAKIAANIIATPHIANQGILSASIGAAIIGTPHLADGAVVSAKLGSGIVGLPHLQPWASGKVIVGQGTTATPITIDQQAAIGMIIDGAGAAITSGQKGHIEAPFPATINRVTLACDQSGNIDLDIYKGTYAAFPPTTSICSGAWPHTSGNIKYQDSILSNWVQAIASGDILAFVAKGAASSIQRCTVSLGVYK